MPKLKSVKASRDNDPYNLNKIKDKLKNWKNEARDYEKRTADFFEKIKEYISVHMSKMTSDEVVDLYDCVSKALDQIERKGTNKIARLDNFITSLVEDRNLDEVIH